MGNNLSKEIDVSNLSGVLKFLSLFTDEKIKIPEAVPIFAKMFQNFPMCNNCQSYSGYHG